MKVPLTDEQIATEKTMPKIPAGYIVNPRYVPDANWGRAYIREWGIWCRSNPRSLWPDWLTEYVNERRRASQKGVGRVLDGDDGGTEGEGDGE